MRLLNANTFELEEHIGVTTPKYTILSHAWNKDEVLFTDIFNDFLKAKRKHGFKKIEFCARQTLKDGFSYCWVDTCCIDKSSSAELSEAINSMFGWYSRAQKCYVYLEDVRPWTHTGLDALHPYHNFFGSIHEVESMMNYWKTVVGASRWFTRGWTLQELIAPYEVIFYSQDWRPLCNKQGFADILAEITGISRDTLKKGDFREESIAERMSWASQRSTTRQEDEAYCLMGIFNVNMPPLYGEGAKAFIRLQEEIIKNSDDRSIFLWTADHPSRSNFRGLLAKSPREFKSSKNILSLPSTNGEPYSITNRGLKLSLPSLAVVEQGPEILCPLGYTLEANNRVAIRMMRLEKDQFARVELGDLVEIENEASTSVLRDQFLYVRNELRLPPNFVTDRIAGFSLVDFKSTIFSYSVWPESGWSIENMFYRFEECRNDGPNILEATGAKVLTARIIWQNTTSVNDFWRNEYLLFEFHFNTGPITAASGLASPTGSSTITQYGFRGTLCPVNSTYDISSVPTLEDICSTESNIAPFDVDLELGLTIIHDEAVIAGTKYLRALLEVIGEKTTSPLAG